MEWVGKNDLVDVVRSEHANQLTIIGSPNYSRNLSWIKEQAIVDEDSIGWVAAWYDDKWEPVMFSDESGDFTKWGDFIVDLLAESNK